MSEQAKIDMDFTEEEQKEIKRGLGIVQEALKSRNISIEDITCLVTPQLQEAADKQVQVRFAEASSPRMNMIAFD